MSEFVRSQPATTNKNFQCSLVRGGVQGKPKDSYGPKIGGSLGNHHPPLRILNKKHSFDFFGGKPCCISDVWIFSAWIFLGSNES